MLRRTLPAMAAASTIRQRGDPVLAQVCAPLSDVVLCNPDEPCISQLPLKVPAATTKAEQRPRLVSANEMFDDLHAALDQFRDSNGFGRGIAAPQLGYLARAIAINFGSGDRHTLVNPEWKRRSSETMTMWDDCFSFPGHLVRVRRWKTGCLRFTGRDGGIEEWLKLDTGTCELLQHEMDHLDGRLSFARAAPVKVPTALLDKHRKELELDTEGRVAILPRAVFEASKAEWIELVSPFVDN